MLGTSCYDRAPAKVTTFGRPALASAAAACAALFSQTPLLVYLLNLHQSVMKGMSMGKLTLPATPPGQKTEACLTLVSSSSSNSRPVFNNLADIQIIRHEPGSSSAAAGIASLPAVATGATMDGLAGAGGVPDAVPARSLNVSEQLRLQHGWVQGQGSMESLFAPYDAEDIGECAECLVAI